MHPGATRLVPGLESAAHAFLQRSPYENVFLTWLLTDETMHVVRASMYVYLDAAGDVAGVAFYGRQIVVATQSAEALDAFAETARSYRYERMIVGPRVAVEAFWNRIKVWHRSPRLVRGLQPLLALDRDHLRDRPAGPAVRVRRALPHEWRVVADNSAQMIEHELAYSPRTASEDFNAGVRQMIARGLWWVGVAEDELCFFCNAGPNSESTLQLQGIWTPPALRGKGLASAALHALCDELLAAYPTLSLYVNDFNGPALALYDRIGFYRVGEFSTLLF